MIIMVCVQFYFWGIVAFYFVMCQRCCIFAFRIVDCLPMKKILLTLSMIMTSLWLTAGEDAVGRITLSTDCIVASVSTDVDNFDLAGNVSSITRTVTTYDNTKVEVHSTTYQFDSYGYITGRTFEQEDGTMSFTTYTNHYRQGQLYNVVINNPNAECRAITLRHDISGNVIGKVSNCDTSRCLSSTLFDRFHNPLRINNHLDHSEIVFTYRYDAGRENIMMSSTRLEIRGSDSLRLNTRYTYDEQGKLTQELTLGSDGSVEIVSYAYDEYGRLQHKQTTRTNEVVISEVYDRDDRGSCIGMTVYRNGNLAMKVETTVTYRAS